MSNYEWFIFIWLVSLTVWLLFFKRGPKGDKGVYDRKYHELTTWQISEASMELLDNAEYMARVIQRLNSYQLNSGTKVGEGKE